MGHPPARFRTRDGLDRALQGTFGRRGQWRAAESVPAGISAGHPPGFRALRHAAQITFAPLWLPTSAPSRHGRRDCGEWCPLPHVLRFRYIALDGAAVGTSAWIMLVNWSGQACRGSISKAEIS